MPFVTDLDVALRAYVPAYEQAGAPLPRQVTLTNINQCREATGLTWEVATEPHYRVRTNNGHDVVEKVDTYKYITRGEGGAILGSVGADYHLFYNEQVFGVAEAIGTAALEDGREVRFVSGGEIDGGKRVFLLADLGVREIPGDPSPHVRFMTLLSAHNGGGAMKVLGTNMRWRCTNALRAAEIEAARSAAAFSFRHTSRIAARIADARKAITEALLHHDAIEARTAEMIGTKISAPKASDYLAQFALAQVVSKADPLRVAQASLSAQRATAVAKLETELHAVHDSGTCDGIRGTAYGAFAAVVEYLDNKRDAKSVDGRFSRTMVRAEPGKALAFGLARRLF